MVVDIGSHLCGLLLGQGWVWFWVLVIAWVKNDLVVGNLAMRSDFLGSVLLLVIAWVKNRLF